MSSEQDVQVRKIYKPNGKPWVIVEINGTTWVPKFEHLFWIVAMICDCEDEKYPLGEGRNLPRKFLEACCAKGAKWETIAEEFDLLPEYLKQIREADDKRLQDEQHMKAQGWEPVRSPFRPLS